MANNYTSIPNIIAGNLKVAGSLFVQGYALQVGSATPYVRIFSIPPSGGYWSVNLQPDGITRDDPTRAGFLMMYDCANQNLTTVTVDKNGNTIYGDLRRFFWSDYNTHTITGIAGAQNIATKVIYGNELGPSGSILLRVSGQCTTVAGGSNSLFVNFGGAGKQVIAFPASTNAPFWASILFTNGGATNVQNISSVGAYATSAVVPTATSAAVDTTVNQTLAVQCLPGLATDSLSVYSIEGQFLARPYSI